MSSVAKTKGKPAQDRHQRAELKSFYLTQATSAAVAVFFYLVDSAVKLGYRQGGELGHPKGDDQLPWFFMLLQVAWITGIIMFVYAAWASLTIRYERAARLQQWALDQSVKGWQRAVAWLRSPRHAEDEQDDGLGVIDDPVAGQPSSSPEPDEGDEEEDFQLELPLEPTEILARKESTEES